MSIAVSKTTIPGLNHLTLSQEDWCSIEVCPICESAEEVHPIMEVITGPVLSACYSCRFSYLSRRPTEQWTNNFYETTWDEPQTNTFSAVNDGPFSFCHRYIQQDASVLDVGAGYGGLLQGFKKQGHEVYAIEPSQHRAEYLTSQGIEVVSWDDKKKYDLVTMCHSLEHRYDPKGALREAKSVLTESGQILIIVPDMYQEYPLQAAHYVPHLSLFTMEALLNLLSDEGLTPVKIGLEYDIRILCTPLASSRKVTVSTTFEDTVHAWMRYCLGPHPLSTLVWSTYSNHDRYMRWHIDGILDDPQILLPAGQRGLTRSMVIKQDPTANELPYRVKHVADSMDTVWIK